MAGEFDPYYTWLGIRPEESAGGVDHYRLLGVQPLEENPEVICNAMDQRMHFLRTLQVGKRAAESQALLNEIAAAGGCLLDPRSKALYDRQLRAELARRTLPAAVLPSAVLPAAVLPVADAYSPAVQPLPVLEIAPAPFVAPAAGAAAGHGRRKSDRTLAATAAIVLVAVVGLPLLVVIGLAVAGRRPDAPPTAKGPPASIAAQAPVSVPAVDPLPAGATAAPAAHPATTVGHEAAAISVSLTPQQPPPADGSIDLLGIDPQQVWTIRGAVRRPGGAIETGNQSTALAIPVKFPDQYRLEVDVVRLSGKNSLCFGFQVQKRPLTAVIDGFDSKVSGLACIDGKEIFANDNPLARQGAVLVNGRPSTVRIEVTRKAVDLSVDGRTICRWDNNRHSSLRSAQGMKWTGDEALCVFTWDASYRITRLAIVPLEEQSGAAGAEG